VEYIVGIEKAFKEHIGSDSINKLRENITDKPMILIAGDQLTGKSTQAKNLAEHYNGTFYSVGNLFREVATKRGITVAEQAKLLLTERGIDVEIDYKTCEMISGKSIDTNLGVIEGRQPAYMGSCLPSITPRLEEFSSNIFSMFNKRASSSLSSKGNRRSSLSERLSKCS